MWRIVNCTRSGLTAGAVALLLSHSAWAAQINVRVPSPKIHIPKPTIHVPAPSVRGSASNLGVHTLRHGTAGSTTTSGNISTTVSGAGTTTSGGIYTFSGTAGGVIWPSAGTSTNLTISTAPAGFGFYQPMYEVPANVIGPTIPPAGWTGHLFTGMTTGGPYIAQFGSTPSLWPGHLFTGMTTGGPYIAQFGPTPSLWPPPRPGANPNPGSLWLYGTPGGGPTGPNPGSLWLYGTPGGGPTGPNPGSLWGTSVSNDQLTFPVASPYSNQGSYFGSTGANPYSTWIGIGHNLSPASSDFGAGADVSGAPVMTPPAGKLSNVPTSNGGRKHRRL